MNLIEQMEALSKDLKRYFSTNVALLKLEALDKSSGLGASVVSRLLVWLVAIFALLFFSMWAALYLSALLGAHYLGFGIVGGVYLLLFFILYIGRESFLEKPIRNSIIANAQIDQDPNSKEPNTKAP